MTTDSDLLQDKVVIVTGAGQGLGLATALGFGRRGAKVALVDNNQATLNDAVMQMPNCRIQSIPILTDITAPGAAGAIVQKTIDAFGRIDVLVNNAAISSVEPFLEVSEREWDKVFDINVKALFFLLQAAARVMKNTGGGRIINVSSPAARMTREEYVAYSTSKSAVDYITRTAAAALGCYGITVNTVSPGRMDTAMQRANETASAAAAGIDLETYVHARTVDIPLRRRTTPEEVAQAIIWLATQPASYVTANRLNISGGLELD
jgi:NAD(P)-dependent dehydrogenase (short-subunit alcohol dehydrogenase family)